MNNLNFITTKWITIFLGIFLFTYIVLRAYLLSMTHDESLSFTILSGDNSWTYTANNHLLNTKLMTYCSNLFGNQPLSLRLPNVISFIIYFAFCIKLLSQFESKFIQISGYGILLLNPFLLDFFSLARGYGLSLGLLMASLFYLFQQLNVSEQKTPSLKNYYLFLLFGSLSIYANLGLINYFMAAHILLAIKIRKLTPFLIMFLLGSIPILWTINKLKELSSFNQLYFGEDTLNNCMQSILNCSLYNQKYAINTNIVWLILIPILLLSLLSIYHLKTYKSNLLYLILLNTIILLALIFEHYLMDAKFPKERTALYFVPLLGLTILESFNHFYKHYTYSKTAISLASTLMIFATLFHFYQSANVQYSLTWQYDANTKNAIESIIENNPQDSVTVSSHWLFEPSIKYYIQTAQLKIKLMGANETSINPDYFYRYQDNNQINNYLIIKDYPLSESNLIKLQAK